MKILHGTDKPVILNWPPLPDDNGDVLAWLEQNALPCILGAGRSAQALARSPNSRASNVSTAIRQAPTQSASSRASTHLPAGAGTLGEHRSKQLLSSTEYRR